MKKLIAMILIACMACMLVPAMADEDLTGDWYLKTMSSEGKEYDAAAVGYSMVVTLNTDGTASAAEPDGSTETGTWAVDNGTITLTIGDDPAVSGPVADGAFTLDTGSMSMTFTRDAVEAITVAEVVAAESADVFNGEWACAYIESDGMIADPSGLGEEVQMPAMTISEEGFAFAETANGYGTLFNTFALSKTFEDDKLTVASGLEGVGITGTVELLADGMIKLTLVNGDNPMILYYAPAAAAEEPAA